MLTGEEIAEFSGIPESEIPARRFLSRSSEGAFFLARRSKDARGIPGASGRALPSLLRGLPVLLRGVGMTYGYYPLPG